MKSKVFIFALILGALYMQGCSFLNTYDIEVVNDSGYAVSIYLDDEYQFYLESGESATISSVSGGDHTLEATVDLILWVSVLDEKTFDLDSDITWTIY
jgi:hypothetical protein